MTTSVGRGWLAAALGCWVALAGEARGDCPGACSVPGGGPAATDCFVEYDGITLNKPARRPRLLRCRDGDPACDVDGVANGTCRVLVRACVNNADTRLARCTPSDVTSFRVRNGRPGTRAFDPELAALEAAVGSLGLPATAAACTEAVALTVPLRGRKRFGATPKAVRSQARSSTGRTDTDAFRVVCTPSAELPRARSTYARARVITARPELIEGPLARGVPGDVLMVNDRIQVVIQQPGRAMFGIGPYGGTIIDADHHRAGGVERDHFEELTPSLNVENTANYTDVQVLNDGRNGQPAVVRATGPDDLNDFVNPSAVVEMAGFALPANLDDRDLPVDVQTDYVLEAGTTWVRIETTVTNLDAAPIDTFLGDFLNGSGELELFQPSIGFGEPLVTTGCPEDTWLPCAAGTCDPCDFIAYGGLGTATDLSYGYVHASNGSTTFSVSGVTAALLGNRVLFVLIGAATPNVHLAPAGSTGDRFTITRWFVVGDGSVSSIADMRNALRDYTRGTFTGTVTAGGAPVADVDVSVLSAAVAGGPSANVVDHLRTDEEGVFTGTLPAGTYTVQANKDGRLAGSPASATVTVTDGGTVRQDFTFGTPGRLRVTVAGAGGAPLPGKIQLVGFDPSPDPFSRQSIAGIINNTTGVFSGLREDGMPYGIAFIAFAGANGDTGEMDVEPGSYQVWVSRGTRYSAFVQDVTITAGATTAVAATLVRVVDTPGFVTTDFHVHSIDSPDSEVARVDRLITQIAEGIDFFTPSEHDIRVDFQPLVESLGLGDLIATAPSAEITTFDYGHFNSWPVTVDSTKVNGGSVDWGRAGVPPGADFPSRGNYGLTPAEIFAAAHADPKPNLVQINHIDSFFNTVGLDIDTAENGTGPPTSHATAASRRLDPAVQNYFDTGFETLEVWNGSQTLFLGENIGDWFNLLNQGIRRSAVADSDTHERRTNGGAVRSYVASAVTAPGALAAEAATLAANVVAGRAVGTNGPFVGIEVRAASTNQVAGPALGLPDTVTTTDGAVDVTVTVQAPPWAEFDRIELYVNNAPQPYDHDATPATRPRYRVAPDFVRTMGTDFTVDRTTVDPNVVGASRLGATTTFALAGLTADAWIVALVRGTDGVSRPLFPVLPYSLPAEGNTTLAELTDGNLGEGGELALAFTNPLYVDADADGEWTAPGVRLTPP